MSPRHKAYLLLLLTAIIWGFASPIIKHTTLTIPPLIFLAYRFFLSTVVALIWIPKIKNQLPKSLSSWAKAAFYGFLATTVTLGLYFVGTNLSSSLTASISSSLQPLITVVAGVVFLKEHITKREKAGIAVTLAGVGLVTLEPVFSGQKQSAVAGNLLLLISRVSDTAAALIAKINLRDNVSPLALSHISFVVGFLTLIPIVLLFHSPLEIFSTLSSAPPSAHLGVFYMAVISGTIAYTLWHTAQKTIEVGEAIISYYLHPIFAAPLSAFWLKEQISPLFIISSAVIIIGVVTAELKHFPVRPPKQNPLRK